jgi:hypothetical protein
MLNKQREEALNFNKYGNRNYVTQHILTVFMANEQAIKEILPLLGCTDKNNRRAKLPAYSNKLDKEKLLDKYLNQIE